MTRTGPRRLGFFTRLLDQATAGERYRLATEQIVHAERHGFDSAWVAQHHFNGDEGGLPAPFVFLAHVAARTSRIRLGTGIVTLPLGGPGRWQARSARPGARRCSASFRTAASSLDWAPAARRPPSPLSGWIAPTG